MKKINCYKKASLAIVASCFTLTAQAANFTDIATTAGLDTNSRSAGWADYNNDGCVDVMTVSGTGPRLFQNNCDGTFTDVTDDSGITGPTGAWAAVWADFDADGNIDVYVTGAASATSTGNALWKNMGDGSFENVAPTLGLDTLSGSAGASWVDYDQDGDLDLFVASRFGNTSNFDTLFRNDNGVFTDVSAEAGIQGAADRLTFMGVWFDYDMDGDQDLYLSVDFGTDVLYKNNGDGTFTDVSAEAGIGAPGHGMGVYTGDLNNDGCMDVVSSNNNKDTPNEDELADHGPSIIYLNNCDGTFTVASYASGIKDRGFVNWGVNFIDYDNDGDLDFAEVAGGMLSTGEPNAFYENDGTGHLFDITAAAGVSNAGAAFGSSWADIDNDGDLDWLVSNAGSIDLPNALYRNDSASGHYLKVKLNGADKNIDAVGAVVKITSGSRTQMRTIQSGLSYGNSEELVAHFGVGVKQTVDSVTVLWPTGGSTELNDIAVDQTLVIAEASDPVVLASVSGSVTDPAGLPVDNATVDVRDAATNQVAFVVRSDINGNYSIADMPAGDYRIAALKPGFVISRILNFSVEDGDALLLNLQLRAPRQ